MNVAPTRTRRQAKREAPEVKAERAKVLLDNPEVREVFDAAEKEIFVEFQRLTMDGSADAVRKLKAIKDEMDALNRLRRVILRPLAVQMAKQSSRKRGLN
jgi:hypothetical protein